MTLIEGETIDLANSLPPLHSEWLNNVVSSKEVQTVVWTTYVPRLYVLRHYLHAWRVGLKILKKKVQLWFRWVFFSVLDSILCQLLFWFTANLCLFWAGPFFLGSTELWPCLQGTLGLDYKQHTQCCMSVKVGVEGTWRKQQMALQEGAWWCVTGTLFMGPASSGCGK